MSASSASRGSPRMAGADIIDLDRYIRASVRPSRHRPVHTRERLVVDAGGVNHVPVELSSSSDSLLEARAYSRDRKQYSHDSGLSDGSYLRQRYRPHRRINMEKPRASSRTADSNSSVREFKAACEKALRDQQEQIARVAELCEKLVQPQIAHNNPETLLPNVTNVGQSVGPNATQVAQPFDRVGQESNQIGQNFNSNKQNFGQNVSQVTRNRKITPCTSDATSSSWGSRNVKIRDKHRSDSCKTYKLIMGKLDELSHLFATRRMSAPPRVVRRNISSGSVSMCDRVVATGDDGRKFNTVKVVYANQIVSHKQTPDHSPGDRHFELIEAHRVDISPGQELRHDGDSANKRSDSSANTSEDAFDLNNPLHFYEQAKKLQAMHISGQRSLRRHQIQREKSEKSIDKLEDKPGDSNSSVCALCRSFWRTIRQYFRQ